MSHSINSIAERILIRLQDIPLEQQQKVLNYIEFIAQESSEHSPNSDASLNKRVLGLHKGKIWMSDDFNEPLPDDYWNFDS
jgi:hypothetical protein